MAHWMWKLGIMTPGYYQSRSLLTDVGPLVVVGLDGGRLVLEEKLRVVVVI